MLERRLSLLAVIVAALFAPGAHADASAEEPRFDPPKHYYLALGDSFTYGFQFSKLGLPPTGVQHRLRGRFRDPDAHYSAGFACRELRLPRRIVGNPYCRRLYWSGSGPGFAR